LRSTEHGAPRSGFDGRAAFLRINAPVCPALHGQPLDPEFPIENLLTGARLLLLTFFSDLALLGTGL
jgi:hypothetical protein